MENKSLILCKSEKDGKTFYYLLIQYIYKSGKTYRELVCFLTATEYDKLSNTKSIDIEVK